MPCCQVHNVYGLYSTGTARCTVHVWYTSPVSTQAEGSCFHSRDGSGVSPVLSAAAVVFTPESSWTPGTGASFPTGDCGAIHRSLSVHRPQPSGVSAGSENSIAVVICASTRPLVSSEECWQKTGKVWIINHSLEREETAIHREREKAWGVRMEWRC